MPYTINKQHRILFLTAFALVVGAVLLVHNGALAANETLTNPLGITCPTDNRACITVLLNTISRGLIGLVAVLATFMFILGGLMMLTSGGSSQRVEQAKKVLQYTTMGIVVIILSATILQFIFTSLGANSSITSNLNSAAKGTGLQTADAVDTATRFMLIALGLLGVVAVVMMIVSGYMWLTAAGSEQRVSKAKAIMFSAIAGLVVVLLSWAIVNFVIGTTNQVTNTQQQQPIQCKSGETLCDDGTCELDPNNCNLHDRG